MGNKISYKLYIIFSLIQLLKVALLSLKIHCVQELKFLVQLICAVQNVLLLLVLHQSLRTFISNTYHHTYKNQISHSHSGLKANGKISHPSCMWQCFTVDHV